MFWIVVLLEGSTRISSSLSWWMATDSSQEYPDVQLHSCFLRQFRFCRYHEKKKQPLYHNASISELHCRYGTYRVMQNHFSSKHGALYYCQELQLVSRPHHTSPNVVPQTSNEPQRVFSTGVECITCFFQVILEPFSNGPWISGHSSLLTAQSAILRGAPVLGRLTVE